MNFARLRKFYVLHLYLWMCIISVFVFKWMACYAAFDMAARTTNSQTGKFSTTPNQYKPCLNDGKASSSYLKNNSVLFLSKRISTSSDILKKFGTIPGMRRFKELPNYNVSLPASNRSDPKCNYSVPEVVWVTSRSVLLQRDFTCLASECVIDCGLREGYNSEKWNCTLHTSGSGKSGLTQVSISGSDIPRKQSRFCSIQLKVGDSYHTAGHFEITTKDGRPAKPGPVVYWNVSTNDFVASWVPSPHTDVDPVDYYVLTILHDKPNYRHNPSCWFPEKGTQDFKSTKPKPFTLSNLLPYFVYKVWVTAYNSVGSQAGDIVTVITKPAEPEGCQNVLMEKLNEDASIETEPAYLFKWSEPCRWNGPPRDTRLVILGSRPDNHLKQFRYEKSFPDTENEFRFNPARDFEYSVELWARLEGNLQALCAQKRSIHEPPGLSSVTKKWPSIRPEVLNSDDGETSIARIPLSGNLLNDSNGTIKHLAIMVAENGQEGTKERKFLPLPKWPEERNWASAVAGDHVLLYQATPKYWNVVFEDNATYWFNLGSETCETREKFNFGEETSSSDEKRSGADLNHLGTENSAETSMNSTASEDDFYCNGPLRRHSFYVVRLRVFTAAGYSDSDEMYFKTGDISEDEPFYRRSWFKAFFPGFLSFVFLAAIWIQKKRIPRSVAPSSPNPINATSSQKQLPIRRRRSIPPQKFPEVAAHLLSHREDLKMEFEELNDISARWSSKVPCSVGRIKENRIKNRYADVLPYDYNRVKLSEGSTNQTDYINASFVKGFSLNTEYIACQGPKPETSNDFWQMVFDQNVSFIVMLTSLIEDGVVKCSQYFAEPCEEKDWDDYTVKCSTPLDLATYTIRELEVYKKTIKKQSCCPEKYFPEKRSVQHFHFRDWPDFGSPKSVDGILEFCDVVRGNFCLGGDTKAVVHCSAGIGRTGTLIALDILLQYVHFNRNMDIMQTVLRLREQRQWMVRTLEQYTFLYQCLKTASESCFSTAS